MTNVKKNPLLLALLALMAVASVATLANKGQQVTGASQVQEDLQAPDIFSFD